jgi:H+/Cl- antiporter ClcA
MTKVVENVVGRGLAAVAAIGSAALAGRSFWFTVVTSTNPGDRFLFLIFGVPLGTLAWLFGWYALWGDRPETRDRIRIAWKAGFGVGLLVFLVFFIGPVIVTPESNQGPLAGFLFGPLGFTIGAIAGAVYGRLRR